MVEIWPTCDLGPYRGPAPSSFPRIPTGITLIRGGPETLRGGNLGSPRFWTDRRLSTFCAFLARFVRLCTFCAFQFCALLARLVCVLRVLCVWVLRVCCAFYARFLRLVWCVSCSRRFIRFYALGGCCRPSSLVCGFCGSLGRNFAIPRLLVGWAPPPNNCCVARRWWAP